jgi:hypothetical protein
MAKKRAHGDVLGLSRAPIKAKSATAKGAKKTSRRRIKGIEVAPARTLKRARVVGGVRGRGR